MLPVESPVKAFETEVELVSPAVIVPLLVGLTSMGLLISELEEYWNTTVVLVPPTSPFPTTVPFSVAPVVEVSEAATVATKGAAGVVKLNVLDVVVPVALVAKILT